MSDPIVIEADAVELIPVTLVGQSYKVKPPKAALAMRLATESKLYRDDPSKMMAVLDEWMSRAFGKDAAKVKKRLDSPDDDLDITNIMALMEKVIERQTGNPTS